MGSLQENLSEEVAQKFSVSEQKIRELSQSVESQNKSVEGTNELLRDLMMGLENMDDNMKLIREHMDYWRNPEVHRLGRSLLVFRKIYRKKSLFLYWLVKGQKMHLFQSLKIQILFLQEEKTCFQWVVSKGFQAPLPPRNFQIHLLSVGCKSGYRLFISHTQ